MSLFMSLGGFWGTYWFFSSAFVVVVLFFCFVLLGFFWFIFFCVCFVLDFVRFLFGFSFVLFFSFIKDMPHCLCLPSVKLKKIPHVSEHKLSHLASKLFFSSSDIRSLLHPNSFHYLKKKILSSA